ncbi:hypothetical protein ACVWYN_002677 [Pedobacter sp. UYP24]
MGNKADFSINVKKQKTYVDLVTRLTMEGMQLDGYNVSNPAQYDASNNPGGYKYNGIQTPETDGFTVIAPTTFDTVLSYKPIPTRIGLVTEIHAWSSGASRFRLSSPGLMESILPANYLFHSRPATIIRRGDTFYIGLRGLITTNTKRLTNIAVQLIRASCDMNYSAENSMYLIADSLMEGRYATIPDIDAATYTASDIYTFMMRNWYNANGNDCRIIDKSIGGKSSIDYENYRQQGRLDLIDPPSIIFYALGTNDTNAATYKSNVKIFLKWALTKWPNAKIVVLGPLPAQGNFSGGGTMETFLNSIRTNGAAAVSEINTELATSSRCIFINLGLAFSVADNAQYSTTEADGSHVHIGLVGNISTFNYIKTQINTFYPSFATL